MHAELVALALCAWSLTYALHSSILIALAWISSALLARIGRLRSSLALARERLWKLALVGGIATATLQTALGGGPWSLVADAPASEPLAPVESAVPSPAHSIGLPSSAPLFLDPASFSRSLQAIQRKHEPAPARGAAPSTPPAEGVESAAPRSVSLPPIWIRTILGLWLGGVLLGLARWALDRRRLAAALRGRRRITRGTAREVFDALVKRTGLGSGVRLLEAPCITSPITIGFLRPAICIPPRAESELQQDELEALLAHELAHALRHDPAWLCACRAIEVVLFFQPLNRLARVHLADEAEYLCDDWAVRHTRERLSLASCLTEIAGWIVGRERELSAPGMAARGSRLELRVRRVLDGGDGRDGIRAGDGFDGPGRSQARIPRWMSPLACGVVGAVALFVPGVSARGGVLAESAVLAGDGAPSEPTGLLALGGVAADQDLVPDEDAADEPITIGDRSDGAQEASLIDFGVQALLAGVLTAGRTEAVPPGEPSVAKASEDQPRPPEVSSTESKEQMSAGSGEFSYSAVAAGAGTTPSSTTHAPPPAASLGSAAPLPLVDAQSIAAQPDVADALAEARAFSADITALEQALAALKTELSRRDAPTEFKRRLKSLEDRLRTLQKQRTQLLLYMNLPTLRVAAPRAARLDDHLTTNDRK